MELTVYPRDAEIVSQTLEPALDPVKAGALSVNPIKIYSRGAEAQALLDIQANEPLPVAISFEVELRVAGQSFRKGTVVSYPKPDARPRTSGNTIEIGIPALAPEVTEADLVLIHNPKLVETIAAVDRIWGGEIVFRHVPLKRLDRGGTHSINEVRPDRVNAPIAGPIAQTGSEMHVASVGLIVFLVVPGVLLLLVIAVVTIVIVVARRQKNGGAGKAIAIGCLAMLGGGMLILLLAVGGAFWLRASKVESARRQMQVQRDGVWAIKYQAEREAEARAVAEAAARASTGASGKFAFGPVAEQVLRSPQSRVAELLDLDTGKRGTSTTFGENDRETHAWIRSERQDVLGVVEKGQVAVLCMDMVVVPAVTNAWDAVTPKNIATNWQLRQTEPNKITAISTSTDKTDTWLFETREGGRGILQILGQTDNPPGVNIRYKLVQATPGTEKQN